MVVDVFDDPSAVGPRDVQADAVGGELAEGRQGAREVDQVEAASDQ